jgi:SET domain-containing protein
MLLVRTRLEKSAVHGIGLFADQFIPKGTTLWRFHPTVDTKHSLDQLSEVAPPSLEQLRRYTYREKYSGLYVLCGDDARFFNHAKNPNCIDVDDGQEGITVAVRDIQPGEEMTCDYALFDLDLIEGQYQL